MTSQQKKIAWLAGTAHMLCHGFMTIFPGVMIVLATEQSLGFFALGVTSNLAYFLFGFGSIPAGFMADRYGAQRMLGFSILGMSLSSALIAASPNIWAFGFSFALLGLFASIYHPAGLSFISAHIEKRGKALGLHGVLGNVGLASAPLAAGLLVKGLGSWRAAYLIFGLAGILYTSVLLRFRVEGEEPFHLRDVSRILGGLFSAITGRGEGGRSLSGSDPSPVPAAGERDLSMALPLLYAGCVLFGLVYRGSVTFFPALFASEVNQIAVSEYPVVYAGLLTSAVLLSGTIGQWAAGILIDRLPRAEWGHVVIFLFAIPFLFLVGRSTDHQLVAWAVAFNIVFYTWQPIQNNLVARFTGRGVRGIGFGMNFFLLMGVGSIATAIGGYIAEVYGVYKVYQVLAWVSVLSLAVSLLVVRFSRHRLRFTLQYQMEVDRP